MFPERFFWLSKRSTIIVCP
uniref:Uncharacterized protein n=1 Tax=Anguilla anguilla TaxID=7936 RepID=A0A0E9TA86_ANGAN